MKTSTIRFQQFNSYAITYTYELLKNCPTFISTVELNAIEQLRKKLKISELQADLLRKGIELKKMPLQEMYIQQNSDLDRAIDTLVLQCIDDNPDTFSQPMVINSRFPSGTTALKAIVMSAVLVVGLSITVSQNITSMIFWDKNTPSQAQENLTQPPENSPAPLDTQPVAPQEVEPQEVEPQEISEETSQKENQLPPKGLTELQKPLNVAAELVKLEVDNADYNELRDWYCIQTRKKDWSQIDQDEKQAINTELVGRLERLTPVVRQALKSRYTAADRSSLTERTRRLGLKVDEFDPEINNLFFNIFGEVTLENPNSAASNIWFAMLEQKITEVEQLANPSKKLSTSTVALVLQP